MSVPVGCDTVSLDDWSPALREILVVLSSRITLGFFMYIFTLECETTLSRNVGRQSRGAASPYSRGTETSTAPLRKSQDSQLKQIYISEFPIILNENFQRESHKPYGPTTSVT